MAGSFLNELVTDDRVRICGHCHSSVTENPSLLRTANSTNWAGQLSRDMRWVAYESNETDRFEIVVQQFPNSTGKWQISSGGGMMPRWRADGKELFYVGFGR